MKEQVEAALVGIRTTIGRYQKEMTDRIYKDNVSALALLESTIKAQAEELEERDEYIRDECASWKEFLACIEQAWPGKKLSYQQSPFELIGDLIAERDHFERAGLKLAERYGYEVSCSDCMMVMRCTDPQRYDQTCIPFIWQAALSETEEKRDKSRL